jgi:hypothetical protein
MTPLCPEVWSEFYYIFRHRMPVAVVEHQFHGLEPYLYWHLYRSTQLDPNGQEKKRNKTKNTTMMSYIDPEYQITLQPHNWSVTAISNVMFQKGARLRWTIHRFLLSLWMNQAAGILLTQRAVRKTRETFASCRQRNTSTAQSFCLTAWCSICGICKFTKR